MNLFGPRNLLGSGW